MKLMLASVLPMRLPEERDEEMVTSLVLLFSTTVTIGFCGFEVAKASAAAKARVCILGVVKFFKVPFLQQFSTDLNPKD